MSPISQSGAVSGHGGRDGGLEVGGGQPRRQGSCESLIGGSGAQHGVGPRQEVAGGSAGIPRQRSSSSTACRPSAFLRRSESSSVSIHCRTPSLVRGPAGRGVVRRNSALIFGSGSGQRTGASETTAGA